MASRCPLRGCEAIGYKLRRSGKSLVRTAPGRALGRRNLADNAVDCLGYPDERADQRDVEPRRRGLGGRVGGRFARPAGSADGHWAKGKWQRIPVPSPAGARAGAVIEGIAAGSDVWAAGYWSAKAGQHRTLTERWTGGKWRITAGENAGTLAAVAVGGSRVWAVGSSRPEPSGRSRWRSGGPGPGTGSPFRSAR